VTEARIAERMDPHVQTQIMEAPSQTPERIGKYYVVHEVGRGSTGTVYLSHDPFYGRDVAIKFYHATGSDDAEGRNALERYEQSRGLERAISLFNRALEQDPRYALAHAGLGEAYWRLYQNEKNPELVPLAERHCERALALDDLFGRAWVTLGMIHAGTGRAEAALADFQKALDRDPRDAGAVLRR